MKYELHGRLRGGWIDGIVDTPSMSNCCAAQEICGTAANDQADVRFERDGQGALDSRAPRMRQHHTQICCWPPSTNSSTPFTKLA
ncbi:hypothetical protein, partial [Paraburkholderia tropica]|uniref:hypothetical protein n=1 Tax=Paraburkholderia tropica TaxID=92647 RepID=UPI002AAFBF4A